MQHTIDVTGLPEAIVRDIRQLVDTLRGRLTATPGPDPSPAETPEEWVRRLTVWAESHPRRAIEIDDSRDTIYGGRGE